MSPFAAQGQARSASLEVRVAREALFVHAHQRAGLVQGHAVAPHGQLGEAAHARDQIFAGVADVAEHVGDGVAGDDVLDLVAAARGQRDVDGVGVAEQVVQVAQDFLVGADQEDAQVVLAVRA